MVDIGSRKDVDDSWQAMESDANLKARIAKLTRMLVEAHDKTGSMSVMVGGKVMTESVRPKSFGYKNSAAINRGAVYYRARELAILTIERGYPPLTPE